jgi:hypothetical protein
MKTQSTQRAQVAQSKNTTKRAPRYKFDETWIESINRCISNGHDYNDRNHNGHGNNDRNHAYSADDIANLIRQYLEGTNDCTELYDSSFGCAWVVIKAEIDRRKARNARARERRLQRRAGQQPKASAKATAKNSAFKDSASNEAVNSVESAGQAQKETVNVAQNEVVVNAIQKESVDVSQNESTAMPESDEPKAAPKSNVSGKLARLLRKSHKRHNSKKKHSKRKR